MKITAPKIFWFDTETGGLDVVMNSILTLSALIEINGELVDELELCIRPPSNFVIEDGALAVNGLTRERIERFDVEGTAHGKLTSCLGRYVSKFDKQDKFVMAGYNVWSFDQEFLRAMFLRLRDKYFGSWFTNDPIDPLPVLRFLKHCGVISLASFKLTAACEYFGIELQAAHTSKGDIVATRELCRVVGELIELP